MLDTLSEKTKDRSVIIPGKFIPGDSCNCYEYRNSDRARRNEGREHFIKRSSTTYFNRKLNDIDSTVLSCDTYQEFVIRLRELLTNDHNYEGDSFHMLLEPSFGLSIYDQNIELRKTGYSKFLDIIYSTENGVAYTEDQFESAKLIPGYQEDDQNHLYVFIPIHENDEAYGYLIFRDCMEKVANHFLMTYQSRLALILDKFRHSLSLDLINKRLMEAMRRDPLTNVNNRMAYDDKEKALQAAMDAGTCPCFAIAMFDVNNLKRCEVAEIVEYVLTFFLHKLDELFERCTAAVFSPFGYGGHRFGAELVKFALGNVVHKQGKHVNRHSLVVTDNRINIRAVCHFVQKLNRLDTEVNSIAENIKSIIVLQINLLEHL